MQRPKASHDSENQSWLSSQPSIRFIPVPLNSETTVADWQRDYKKEEGLHNAISEHNTALCNLVRHSSCSYLSQTYTKLSLSSVSMKSRGAYGPHTYKHSHTETHRHKDIHTHQLQCWLLNNSR